ncbi:MAG: hypothetical protein QXT81_01490 [Candidatus Bathyarchaeia archaeon]
MNGRRNRSEDCSGAISAQPGASRILTAAFTQKTILKGGSARFG